MKGAEYPDLERLCRLCIKEENVSFDIFSTDDSQLSIPMRIMTVASLEVKSTDGFPKKICSNCRYELEKSFLFRKRCQMSENKLRKHLRLLSLGKKSRVFHKPEDEDDEDELEFEDSIRFLKQQDEIKSKNESKWKENYKQKMEALLTKKLEESKTGIQKECESKLREEVKETVRNELKQKVHDEVKAELRSEVIAEVRAELLDELKEESRKEQITVLIDELESFLVEKRASDDSIKYNIIEKAARNAEILPQAVGNSPEGQVDTQSERKTSNKCKEIPKQETAEANENEFLELSTDSNLEDDIEVDTQIDKDDDDVIVATNNEIYILSDNIEIAKPVNMEHDQETPLTLNDELDTDSFILKSDDNKRITSYKIKENGEIQFCEKKMRITSEEQQQETSSNVVLLDLDDDVVEFVNIHDKSFFLKDKSESDPPTEIIMSESREEKQFSKINLSSNGNGTSLEDNDNSSTAAPQRPTDTVKSFGCKLCPIIFSTENSLKRHMRSHQRVEEKGIRYQCNLCKLYLSCSSALKRHILIHTGEKPFVCTECGKSFVQREILKRHMDTHTGIRPFECEHCNQRFAQKINLQTHVSKMHLDGPKWHTCHLCSKKFSHASGLSRHLRTHTGIMYQCVVCMRHFVDRSSVKRHYTTVHGITSKSEESYIIVKPEK